MGRTLCENSTHSLRLFDPVFIRHVEGEEIGLRYPFKSEEIVSFLELAAADLERRQRESGDQAKVTPASLWAAGLQSGKEQGALGKQPFATAKLRLKNWPDFSFASRDSASLRIYALLQRQSYTFDELLACDFDRRHLTGLLCGLQNIALLEIQKAAPTANQLAARPPRRIGWLDRARQALSFRASHG